jgi:hypothetical protein
MAGAPHAPTACSGAVSSSSGSMSRPPKRLVAAVGRWELFGWVCHVPVSSCGSDDE